MMSEIIAKRLRSCKKMSFKIKNCFVVITIDSSYYDSKSVEPACQHDRWMAYDKMIKMKDMKEIKVERCDFFDIQQY